ncbi:MAG: tetratricopeptide repeat protein [Bdellovibrionota bacterium]
MGVLLGARGADLFRRPHERGDLVVTVLKEQEQVLRGMSREIPPSVELRGWPDDFIALQQWLILTLARDHNPAIAARRLEALEQDRSISPVLMTSLRRWRSTLQQWSGMALPVSSESLLELGRLKHFEASGYRKIGRLYDGTALFLWSSTLLTRFIEENPGSKRVPEALYFLGINYLRLNYALPRVIRGDRLLNLCSEIFPNSIWAQQANEFWRKEMVHGV